MKRVISLPRTIVDFARSVVGELRAVEWLTFSNVVKFTLTVVAVTILVIIIIALMDAILVNGRNILLTR